MRWTRMILLVVSVGLVFAPAAQADTFTVEGTGDVLGVCSPSCASIRQALASAYDNPGPDTVVVPAGTYQLSNGALAVNSEVTMSGGGARATTIIANANARVLEITGNAAISDVTVRGGTATDEAGFFGGNIRAQSVSVSLTRVHVTGGSASSGGGIANNNGTMLIQDSLIDNNSALTGGGDGGGVLNFGGRRGRGRPDTAQHDGGVQLGAPRRRHQQLGQPRQSGHVGQRDARAQHRDGSRRRGHRAGSGHRLRKGHARRQQHRQRLAVELQPGAHEQRLERRDRLELRLHAGGRPARRRGRRPGLGAPEPRRLHQRPAALPRQPRRQRDGQRLRRRRPARRHPPAGPGVRRGSLRARVPGADRVRADRLDHRHEADVHLFLVRCRRRVPLLDRRRPTRPLHGRGLAHVRAPGRREPQLQRAKRWSTPRSSAATPGRSAWTPPGRRLP